jgi:hypothetical protein
MRLGTKFIELFHQIGEFQHRSLKPFLPSQLTLSPFKHEQFAFGNQKKVIARRVDQLFLHVTHPV